MSRSIVNQIAIKIAIQTQTLLRPEKLDPRILEELDTNVTMLEILAIKALDMDLIDNLLQTNWTSPSLQEYRKQAKQDINL